MTIDTSVISSAISKVIIGIYPGDDYINNVNCPVDVLARSIVDGIDGAFDGYVFCDDGYQEELAIKIIRMLNEKYF